MLAFSPTTKLLETLQICSIIISVSVCVIHQSKGNFPNKHSVKFVVGGEEMICLNTQGDVRIHGYKNIPLLLCLLRSRMYETPYQYQVLFFIIYYQSRKLWSSRTMQRWETYALSVFVAIMAKAPNVDTSCAYQMKKLNLNRCMALYVTSQVVSTMIANFAVSWLPKLMNIWTIT